MYLKSLELNGFKSFASKTVLDFPAGITAIVGPNGSGKSNIIDAVRWLLGERENKNLRSAKAENLIFNGAPKKAKMSMAQAGLYFDNGSGFFPVDFKEVAVTKRVTRDGISQYFINKSEVRHKDIIDFFSRSRLGAKGLTIIGQGDSDLFVKASTQERRAMIEEILGLREYQIKKNEAERKLKNTGFNLEKVSAMMAEVAPRLRMLKRQTNKWLKRTEIENELKGIENFYFSQKLKEITDKEDEISPTLNQLERQIAEKRKEISVAETELKKIEARPQEYSEMKEIKNKREGLSVKRSEIEKELGRLEAKMEFLGKEKKNEGKSLSNQELVILISETKENLERISENSDIEELKKGLRAMINKITDFLNPPKGEEQKPKEFFEFEKLKENLLKDFDKLEKELKSLENREVEIAQGIEDFNKNFQKAFEVLESKRKELADFEERKNKILFEKERLNLRIQDLESQLRQIGRDIKEFPNSDPKSLILNPQFSDVLDIERKMFKLRSELASMGEVDEALIKEAKEIEEHYNFLNTQSADLGKAVVDLRNLIKELSEKIHSEFNGSLRLINEEFNKFFRLMFGGGQAKIKIKNQKSKIKNDEADSNGGEAEVENIENEEDKEEQAGVEIELSLPKKKINSLELLSGGERSLVSIAALFALISISPPPFLLLDEVEATLDENNSRRFANLIQEFSKKTQFIIVTHNRAVMEAADVLYGITVCDEGTSKVISLKMEAAS